MPLKDTETVLRLEVERERWLDSIDPEFTSRFTPREIIRHERRRIPEAMSGREAMHDPDCPCCQMLAEMPGVSFWHLDGCNMDDEFAFSIYERTREEWDAKQREYEEFNRSFAASQEARRELAVDYDDREKDPLWKSTFSSCDASQNNVTIPIGVRVFQIGCSLAEIIGELRIANAQQATIDELNRHFGNLRQVLGQTMEAASLDLLEPVTERFLSAISGVESTGRRFDRAAKELVHQLENLAVSQSPESDLFPEFGTDEDDVPF